VFRIKGEQLKVTNLLALLSKAASVELSVFGENVNIEMDSSDRLRASLKQMVADVRKSSQVDVNYTLPFGIFGPWQKLNVPDVIGVEEGAPGMGPPSLFMRSGKTTPPGTTITNWANMVRRTPPRSRSRASSRPN
jgi:hypothetical protein